MENLKVAIIGYGKVGHALRAALEQAGVQVAATLGRGRHRAVALQGAELVFITVPDGAIATVAKELAQELEAGEGNRPAFALHCSGATALEALQPLAAVGIQVGSLHPLQSFATGGESFKGIYTAIAGEGRALELAKELALTLGAVPFQVPEEQRAAYHAAACMCSNYTVALQQLAQNLLSPWMPTERAALQALLPLLKGTVENLEKANRAIEVLTGPIARGDVATLQGHLAALPPATRKAYCALGLATAGLLERSGPIAAVEELFEAEEGQR